MKKWLIGAALYFLAALAPAAAFADSAQSPVAFLYCWSGSAWSACSDSNPLQIAGTFSATLSGFAPGDNYATLSVSDSSSRVALPSGTVVVVYNTGSVAASVTLGNSGVTATTSEDQVPAGGWMAFTVGSNTYLAGITASSTTSLVLSGGSGLPTGSGGGSGGGGGTVTQGNAGSASSAWYVQPGTDATFAATQSGSWNVGQSGAPWSFNLTELDGTALGAPSSYGTAPSGEVAGVNAYVTNTVGVSDSTTHADLSTINTTLGTPFQAGGSIGNSSFGAATSPVATNPSSTLTLTSSTSAYSAGQIIANNATAADITNPSFAIANSAGGAVIPRLRLSTNDTTSTAWGGYTIQVDLWTATPTWTNGDRGTWSPATGTGSHLGAYTCLMSAEYGDGAYAECFPQVGNFSLVHLASGTTIYWSLQAVGGSGVTGASKVFTLVPEILN